ncbi:putative c6 transcription factor protein [Phaeoacremonium minimum UCRPA7]|uniref:Putative c6 transcription factor protein n=1 Tax=Phaeoacremonium minimum (strain UCR-PA7) TaxID=1286976 RepID=R8BPE9_PHAM7|nr:putative c6 transcription factor protein [Phaeoacremonium minimum UCRPA7]EOO01263.1 putative c6 transcription factor protein [Phaeoacremonium minimum UCRPA7]
MKHSHPRSRTGTVTIPARIRPGTIDEDDEFDDELRLGDAFTQLSVDSPGNPSSSFKGPAHPDHFLRSFRKVSGLHIDDGSLDLVEDFYNRAALPTRRQSVRNTVRLPPIDIARQLFAAQYTYIGTIFSFTDPASFDQLLFEAYQGPPDLADQDACLAYAKVLVILAFGKLYSINQWIDYNGPPGFEYFTHALQLLPDAHEEGSILFVETLALVGYFMQNMNRRDAAFLYIGMALRMAISLGLHQEVSSPGLDDATKEHRRRVWWSIYSMDRILCVKSGNPVTIQDDDVGVALPSKLPGEPEYCPAVVLRHYTKLSQICGAITTNIYRRAPKSGTRLMASVQNIILSLSKWHREMPDELRFDPARLSNSRESVSTLLHYYQCINMTARPLLFHVVQKRLKSGPAEKERDWKAGLTQTTIKVIEMCKNLVATYGYMDSEHAFSAVIVLVMVCVAFPTNSQVTYSMNAGLELLRGMSQRGNSHMASRYELLARLRATFMPDAVPPSTVDTATQLSNMFPQTPSSLGNFAPMPRPRSLSGSSNPSNELFMPGAPMLSINGLHMSTSSALSGAGRLNLVEPQNLPDFQLLNNPSLGENIFHDVDVEDVDMSLLTGNNDFWEEAFANPAGDAGFNLAQWTQAAHQMAVHQAGGPTGGNRLTGMSSGTGHSQGPSDLGMDGMGL